MNEKQALDIDWSQSKKNASQGYLHQDSMIREHVKAISQWCDQWEEKRRMKGKDNDK